MSTELKITKERVLEAASKCEDARRTLKTLFPEVFENDKYFDLSKLSMDGQFLAPQSEDEATKLGIVLEIRNCGNLANKAFFLGDYGINWQLVRDDDDCLCLLPIKVGGRK